MEKSFNAGIDEQGNLLTVNPLILFNAVLNGQEITGLEDYAVPLDPDLAKVKVSFVLTLGEEDYARISRLTIRAMPIDWSMLHPDVAKYLKALEMVNTKVVYGIKRLNDLEEKRKNMTAETVDDPEAMGKLLDLSEEIRDLQRSIGYGNRQIEAIRVSFFRVLSERNPEVYKKLYEVYLSPEGPVEVYVSELSSEMLLNVDKKLIELLKARMLAMEAKPKLSDDPGTRE